ncbi:MAG TPA: STAS/SEC14 domain-containing protein [Anaerolineaceae bacterium]|nr:STAS/SEC14 domain-containing protein [Anaerolineaceae bacterium]HPN50986.1 STAS/SEC14 domain-containing protein [Anaerolineaceae bacterium]
MSVKKINHQGSVVFYADYRGLKTSEELLKTLDELVAMTRSSSGNDLLLSNYEGVSLSGEYMNRVKAVGKEQKGKIKRQAVVGVTGLKTVLLNGFILFTGATNIKAFSTEAEALDWLVS